MEGRARKQKQPTLTLGISKSVEEHLEDLYAFLLVSKLDVELVV